MSKLYVSYVREEIKDAQRLVSEIRTYLPSADIELLQTFDSEILASSDVILCLFSINYKRSRDFQQECTLTANLNKTAILVEYRESSLVEKLKRSSLLSELQQKLRSDNYQWYNKKERDECLNRVVACLGLDMPIGDVTGTLVKFDIRSKRSLKYTIAGKTGVLPEGRVLDVRLPEGSYMCVFSPLDYPECVITEVVLFESKDKAEQTKVIDIDSRVEGYLWIIEQEEQEEQEKSYEEEKRIDPNRQYELGCQYVDESKFEEAFSCFSRGAGNNHTGCQVVLAVLYFKGYGVEQNRKKAFSFSQKSADQSDAVGIRLLGLCFRDGIERNIPQAIEYLNRAIEQNDVESMVCLGDLFHYIERFKNISEAVGWYERAAQQGSGDAMKELGICYCQGFVGNNNGTEGTPDYKNVVFWFRKSAEAGNAAGQNELGLCYSTGLGVAKSLPDAFKWYKMAADQGLPVAQYNVGNCYYNGWGTSVDKSQAFKCFKAAAEQNDLEAQNNLAYCYHYGDGVPVNYKEAVSWWTRVAEQGNVNGQYNLAVCYENGEGCSKNLYLARQWYQKAAEQGNEDAKKALKRLK